MVKVVSLSNEAYKTLNDLKSSNESFSDVVIKIAKEKKKTDIMTLFGKWPGVKKELNDIEKTIYKERKKLKLREVSF